METKSSVKVDRIELDHRPLVCQRTSWISNSRRCSIQELGRKIFVYHVILSYNLSDEEEQLEFPLDWCPSCGNTLKPGKNVPKAAMLNYFSRMCRSTAELCERKTMVITTIQASNFCKYHATNNQAASHCFRYRTDHILQIFITRSGTAVLIEPRGRQVQE